jgi:hypothetical protein
LSKCFFHFVLGPPTIILDVPHRPYRNNEVLLTAKVKSVYRNVKIEWMKDSVPLDTNMPRYRIDNREENGLITQTLLIMHANDEDNGMYSAKATDTAGVSESQKKDLQIQGGVFLSNYHSYSIIIIHLANKKLSVGQHGPPSKCKGKNGYHRG